MKKLFFILMSLLILSACKTIEPFYPEDELFVTRKYAGQFVSANIIPKQRITDVQVIEIFTTMNDFDTIRIYGKRIDLNPGERVYIKRVAYYGIQERYTHYRLETETKGYVISQFGYGDKLLTQSWY